MTLYGDLICMHGTTVRNRLIIIQTGNYIDRPLSVMRVLTDDYWEWKLIQVFTVVSCMIAKLGATS